jgi:nucleotide-binding universal stress UspA family protein
MNMVEASELPRRILLATDLSARCDRATDRAAMLADEWQAELIVLHVLQMPPQGLYDFEPVPSWRRPPDPAEIATELLLDDLGLALTRSQLRLSKGVPAEAILTTAIAEKCDLIVAGVAQDEELGFFRLGRTVERLLRHSRLPLLIVKNRPRTSYSNIISATDFSAVSRYAFETAGLLFPKQSIALFHAFEAPRSRVTDHLAPFHIGSEPAAKEAGERFLEELGPFSAERSRPELLLEPGSASRLLREFVRLRKIDLVSLGTRGRSSLLDVFVGSTAKEIMATLPCDALVVREQIPPAEP